MFDRIIQLPNGAHFYRCDLHTHTPVDKRFNCDGWQIQTEEQKEAFARYLVDHITQVRHLDILGVTEHNDVSWLPYIQAAAREVDLIVFPGVEVGVLAGQKSVHFLALFNPETSADAIDHWLSSIGLLPGQRFHPDGSPRVAQVHPHELTDLICRDSDGLPGIAIAAHAVSHNGLLDSLEGEARVLAYQDARLLAIEIPDTREQLSPFEKELVNGKKRDVYGPKRVACLNHSDGRCVADHPHIPAIGSRSTFIKLSSPTIEGLRQAFLDFESRVRLLDERNLHQYPRIVGIAISGGFLRGTADNEFLLHLNPNLNCIVGGRGSGKSALVELIRYAFEMPAKSGTNETHATQLLRHVLGPGAKVSVFYETEDGVNYRVERVWQQQAQVFDHSTGALKSGLRPAHLTTNGAIEVYGQKEIYEISKDPNFQLNLIDNYITEELHPVLDKESSLLRQLETNADALLQIERDLTEWEQKLDRLPAAREELIRLERQDFVNRLERKKNIDREKEHLISATNAINGLITQLQAFVHQQESALKVINTNVLNLPHEEMLQSQQILLDEVNTLLQTTSAELSEHISIIWERGKQDREAWEAEYRQVEEEYLALTHALPHASGERYLQLQQVVNQLEELEHSAATHRQRADELQSQRRRLLERLRAIRKEAFQIRTSKIEQMKTALNGAVHLSVIREGNRQVYENYLRKLLTGTRITGAAIEDLVRAMRSEEEFYDPIHLVEAIREEQLYLGVNTNVLSTVYKISENVRKRLAQLSDETLYKLETFRIPDIPVISLRLGDQYKPLDELSVGQKCTAVLSLILLERKVPLIIDQPEDDLDNNFIFNEIVQTLRQEKERRQFIIATHNANIPISGDAELIIVLEADEQAGWISCVGSIDDTKIRTPVERILEGGREAFRMRKDKYGII